MRNVLTKLEQIEQRQGQMLTRLEQIASAVCADGERPSKRDTPSRQRERARDWLVWLLQPVSREGRTEPGHTWAEIMAKHGRLGNSPRVSEATLKRARRDVLYNVREGEVSYWVLMRKHEYPPD